MTRLTLDLSTEIDDKLISIAKRNGITKAEAMRRAFALLTIADEEKQKPGFSLESSEKKRTTPWRQLVG